MSIYALISCFIFLLLYGIFSFIGTVDILGSLYQIAFTISTICLYYVSSLFILPKKGLSYFFLSLGLGGIMLYVAHTHYPSSLPFLTRDSLQFILPTEGGHNHLGDLLGLGLIHSLFLQQSFPLFLLQTVFMIFIGISFSKSALLALMGTLFFLGLQIKSYRRIFYLVFCISLFLLSIYSKELSFIPPVAYLQSHMTRIFRLKPKPLLSSRDVYVQQILQPWIAAPPEHLFFGYGPGNFKYASSRASHLPWDVVSDPHNIALMIFTEAGILSLIWFFFFVSFILIIGIRNKDPSVFPVLFLLFNFQTDYTYSIPFFMMAFMLICGQITAQGKSSHRITHALLLISLCCAIAFGSASFLLSQEYEKSMELIRTSVQRGDEQTFQITAKKLEKMTPHEPYLLNTLASFNVLFKNKKEAIRLLDRLFIYSPHEYLILLSHQLNLLKAAKMDRKKYLKKQMKNFATFPYSQKEKDKLNAICKNYGDMQCIR